MYWKKNLKKILILKLLYLQNGQLTDFWNPLRMYNPECANIQGVPFKNKKLWVFPVKPKVAFNKKNISSFASFIIA